MFIQEKDRKVVHDYFNQKLVNPVTLLVFSKEKSKLILPGGSQDCQYCSETEQLVRELAGLSDKISVETVNFEREGERAREYGIDKIPAIAVGIPSGY